MRISDWSSDVCSSDLFGETPDHRSRHHSTRNDSQIPSVMLRRVRPMIRYGGAVCIALGLATGPARAEAGTTAPQIELVISAVADPDASGAAYVELRLLNSGSASETMTLPPQIAAELTNNGGTGHITLERAPQTPEA